MVAILSRAMAISVHSGVTGLKLPCVMMPVEERIDDHQFEKVSFYIFIMDGRRGYDGSMGKGEEEGGRKMCTNTYARNAPGW
jgi:hypothetical protein